MSFFLFYSLVFIVVQGSVRKTNRYWLVLALGYMSVCKTEALVGSLNINLIIIWTRGHDEGSKKSKKKQQQYWKIYN
jgi:hypothetical protein